MKAYPKRPNPEPVPTTTYAKPAREGLVRGSVIDQVLAAGRLWLASRDEWAQPGNDDWPGRYKRRTEAENALEKALREAT